MPSRTHVGRCVVALFVGVLLAMNAGCAGQELRRQQVLGAQAATHVYHRPAPELVAKGRRLLSDTGFVLALQSDDTCVRTQWKVVIDDDEFASLGERYVVMVK